MSTAKQQRKYQPKFVWPYKCNQKQKVFCLMQLTDDKSVVFDDERVFITTAT